VALKVIAPELAEDADFRQRFVREAHAAATIDDPGVIPIHDAGEVDGVLYIAMRLVEGTDLRALLQERGRSSTSRRWRGPVPRSWIPQRRSTTW
jgi:serine/threonine protein kinase